MSSIVKKNFLTILLLLSLTVNIYPLKKYTRTAYLMGTVLTVTIFADDGEKILDKVYEKCSVLEKVFSSRRDDGLVYALNKSSGGMIYDKNLLSLINEAFYYKTLTDGAFDPGLYRIISAWDMEKAKKKPESDVIIKELNCSGWKYIVLDGNKIVLKNGAGLDLGGIAKGRIIGLLSEELAIAGVENYLINAGGDLYAGGLYAGKRGWNIAIADPYKTGSTIGYIMLTNKCIVTSGDYERYFIDPDDGKKYHHIIDPKTGYPTENGLNSVTVISDDPARSDAMSTALFVMGEDTGLKFAEKIGNMEVLFISKMADGKIKYSFTDGLGKRISDDLIEFYLIDK